MNASKKEGTKKWGARSKKVHMTIPLNDRIFKRLESKPNQVHTVFEWELTINDLAVYLKTAILYRKFRKCHNSLPK